MSTTNNPPGGGGSNGTVTPPVPTEHVIASDTMAPSLPAAHTQLFGPFSVPAATVSYMITERTTTLTQDSWTTGVASAMQASLAQAGQPYQAYALKTDVTGTTSATASVPADSYYLAIYCNNIVEDCVYSYEVQATY
jgi:hypothetical protein